MITLKKQPRLYNCSQIGEFIDTYLTKANNAVIATIEEGCLGYGLTVLYDPDGKLKTTVIKEVPVNCWTSMHTVRMYNRCPQKYENWIQANI